VEPARIALSGSGAPLPISAQGGPDGAAKHPNCRSSLRKRCLIAEDRQHTYFLWPMIKWDEVKRPLERPKLAADFATGFLVSVEFRL
jgi:hypothetical protein